jgi:hypothetical protein
MVYIIFIFTLIKPFKYHSCPVEGGIVILWATDMVAKIMAYTAFFTLSMMGC